MVHGLPLALEGFHSKREASVSRNGAKNWPWVGGTSFKTSVVNFMICFFPPSSLKGIGVYCHIPICF